MDMLCRHSPAHSCTACGQEADPRDERIAKLDSKINAAENEIAELKIVLRSFARLMSPIKELQSDYDNLRHQLILEGGSRDRCSCCRKCGAVVPCDEALFNRGCDGKCFCRVENDS